MGYPDETIIVPWLAPIKGEFVARDAQQMIDYHYFYSQLMHDRIPTIRSYDAEVFAFAVRDITLWRARNNVPQ